MLLVKGISLELGLSSHMNALGTFPLIQELKKNRLKYRRLVIINEHELYTTKSIIFENLQL